MRASGYYARHTICAWRIIRMAASRAVTVSIPPGHPHADMRCGGDSMDLRDLPKWIAMYGTMTSDLFKKNIALTYDNMGKVLHALYDVLWFPLDLSLLTCITAAVRKGDHILHPNMVMKPSLPMLNRNRVEAWWRIHKYNNRADASRDDVELVVFGETGSLTNEWVTTAAERAGTEGGVPIVSTPQELEVHALVISHSPMLTHILNQSRHRTWQETSVRLMPGSACVTTLRVCGCLTCRCMCIPIYPCTNLFVFLVS